MINILELVNKTISQNEFYQKKYGCLSFSDFSEIPLLTKSEIIQDQLNKPPFGTLLNCKREEIIRIHRTSGTTQKPLLIPITRRDQEIISEVGSRVFKLAGVEQDEVVINCMNYSMWMGGMMDHQSIEKSGAIAIPFGVGNTESLIDLILSLDKVSIHATPSYMSRIKEVLSKREDIEPRDLNLLRGYFGGESALQSVEFREKLESEWGLSAFNANYGLSEVMSIIGGECNIKSGMHFVADDFLYKELLDEHGIIRSIENGVVGELILTNIEKEAQPLIRYRTGDIIEVLSTDLCDCGDSSFRFRIVGRADDMIVVKGINFFPESVRKYISNFESFTGNYKILVSNKIPVENFTIQIECKHRNNDDAANFLKLVKNNLFVSPDIVLVDEFEIVEGNKFKLLERI